MEWRFAENCRTEQVMHESNHRRSIPSRSVQRNLVQVLNEHVVIVSRESFAEIFAGVELKRVPRADAVHIDSVEERSLRTGAPSARKEIDAVSLRGNATKDLMEMNFGTPAVGILSVVAVDEENPH